MASQTLPPPRLVRTTSSSLSGDTLVNGDSQCQITGNSSGNSGSNNTIRSNNRTTIHNTYIINFFASVSIVPPPTIQGISRTPTELLNTGQVRYRTRRRRREIPALHSAAEEGDEAEVARILNGWKAESSPSQRMRDVGEKDKQNGMNPLHYAAKRGNQTIVRLILSYHGERANFQFHSGSGQKGKKPPKNVPEATPLIDFKDAVKSLLASKSNNHGMDALHYAAEGGHDEVAKVLLEVGTDVKAQCNFYGMNSMHIAALSGQVNILFLLKSYLNSQEKISDKSNSREKNEGKPGDARRPPMNEHTPFPAPGENATNGVPETEHGDWKPVQTRRARRRGRPKPSGKDNPEQKVTLNNMLAATSEKSRMTPLHFAAMGGRDTAVEFLIECGARIEARCGWERREPIHYAARHGHATTVKLLYDLGAKISTHSGRDGMAPLHYAAQMGHEAVVKFLCENKVDFAASCRWRRMIPLHYAAKHGHEVVVRMLVLYNQPSTPLRDSRGRVAAQHAEENGSERTLSPATPPPSLVTLSKCPTFVRRVLMATIPAEAQVQEGGSGGA
ncbi:ankyrin repeat-containing domain protein [Tuber indicum]|nr:ankyrin repeat-containing domain protein [Tuber indicum]